MEFLRAQEFCNLGCEAPHWAFLVSTHHLSFPVSELRSFDLRLLPCLPTQRTFGFLRTEAIDHSGTRAWSAYRHAMAALCGGPPLLEWLWPTAAYRNNS